MQAWQDRESRAELRTALTRHTVAIAGGLKKKSGGWLSLNDFLPAFMRKKAQESPELQEEKLKLALKSIAASQRSNHNG